MGLESGNLPDDLNLSWPLSADPTNQGDDHIRLLKAVIDNWAGTWGNDQIDTLAQAYADGGDAILQSQINTNTSDIATLQTDKADLDGAALTNATLDGDTILTDANYAAEVSTIFATAAAFPADKNKLLELTSNVTITGTPVDGDRLDIFNRGVVAHTVTRNGVTQFEGFGVLGTVLTLPAGFGATIIHRGALWYVIGSGSIA